MTVEDEFAEKVVGLMRRPGPMLVGHGTLRNGQFGANTDRSVEVHGLFDQPFTVAEASWSSAFRAAVAEAVAALPAGRSRAGLMNGKRVTIMFVDGQPEIAYTVGS